jgi:hypothetical protein
LGDVSTPSEYPDPSRLLEDDSPEDRDAAGPKEKGHSGLTIRVRESGPTLPWLLRIVNEGDTPVDLVADTRLLWFEVKLPGQKKATTCKLPDALGPGAPEKRLKVTLEPGEGVQDLFDPRLYCFASGDQKLLVPDAEITPHFGWAAAPPKKVWKGGKRVEEPTLQQPPFVAEGRPEPLPDSAEAVDETAAAKPTKTVKRNAQLEKKKAELAKKKAELEARAKVSDKELIGAPFALRSEYAAWSRRTNPNPPADPADPAKPSEPKPPLALSLVQGSDVRAEHNATVQLTLQNQSSESTHVYFRRELVTFEVTGPKGVTLCNATPDTRAPSREAFVKLTSGAKRAYVSRLAELCPRGTFATPGLYLVYARFDATAAGRDVGLNAFTGPVVSEIPAAVRIRVGEEALLQKRMLPLDVQAQDVPKETIPPTLSGHEHSGPHVPPPPPARGRGRAIRLPAPIAPGGVPVSGPAMNAAPVPADAPMPAMTEPPPPPAPPAMPPASPMPPFPVPPPTMNAPAPPPPPPGS